MENFKLLKKEKLPELPKTTGVYCFRNNGELLYIGKAISIRERVKNHFQSPSYRDNLYIELVKQIGFIETNSEIEALLLEAKLIKQHQPKYNVLWKDDKNYFYVAITKEDFPRVFITHQTDKLKTINYKLKTNFVGPFIEGSALKKTLRLLRKAFPYYVAKNHPKKLCLWCHLNLCPGPSPDKKEYQKNIKKLVAILKGESRKVLKDLEKEMKEASLAEQYEKAAKIRDKVQALDRIIIHAKVFQPTEMSFNKTLSWPDVQKVFKNFLRIDKEISRIEAYDVSNIQGKEATASMVVFIDGNPAKSLYRKFKIKIDGKPNDVAMIKEALLRRLNHKEWPYPDIILIDGGKPQLNTALSALKNTPLTPGVMALAKKKNELFTEGQKDPFLLKGLPRSFFNLILQLRDEAHRFAIAYHRKLRKKKLLS